MNYFELHIGDLTEATAHLSLVEDGAYGRLMRKYYATEKPLPADTKQVQRLIGARSKEERDAVESVLQEFFQLQDDGWHQTRCDAEIAAYRERMADRDDARVGEKERQRRARERRKAAFSVLREHEVVPPWNATGKEIELLLSRVTGPDASRPVTPPVTRDNTASQTPDTRLQSPDTRLQTPEKETSRGADVVAAATPAPAAKATATPRGTRLAADWALPKAWGDWALGEFPHWTPEVIRVIAAGFADHWHAKTGKGSTSLDWLATWRNWCRNDITQRQYPARVARQGPAPVVDIAARNAETRRLLGFGPEEPTTRNGAGTPGEPSSHEETQDA